MVEVGWDGGPEPELEPQPALLASRLPQPVKTPEVQQNPRLESVETIDDRYAALQAWNEWSRNRGRSPSPAPPDQAVPAVEPPLAAESAAEVTARGGSEGHGSPNVWVEGEQGFAPYGQLFSRLRQSRDVNESG
jgi:general secretion pathway protein A